MVRFWKMTEQGAVNVVTLPEALFARGHRDSSQIQQQQQQQQPDRHGHVQTARRRKSQHVENGQADGTGSTSSSPATHESRKQRPPQHKERQTLKKKKNSTGVVRAKEEARQASKMPSSRVSGGDIPHESADPIDLTTANEKDGYDYWKSDRGSSATARKGTAAEGRAVDRFGRIVPNSRGHKCDRLPSPPKGTTIPLGWGWGGEFRLGTGRDGQEASPRHLHPDLKVTCPVLFKVHAAGPFARSEARTRHPLCS